MTAQNRPEKGSGHGSSSPQDDTDTGILDRWCQIEDDAVASLLAAPPPAFGAAMRRAHFPALGACGPGALLSTRPTEHYLNQGGTGLVMLGFASALKVIYRNQRANIGHGVRELHSECEKLDSAKGSVSPLAMRQRIRTGAHTVPIWCRSGGGAVPVGRHHGHLR